jgi:putative ABC transport system permease protein
MAPVLGTDGADVVLQTAVICMLLAGAALSLAAPLTVGLLTRAWTALVPARSASWVLARAAMIAKGERLARTVTPIALTIGLLVGLGAIVATTVALLEAMGRPSIGSTTLVSLLVLVGLVLIVSVSGGLSVVLMMSRQREGELALAGVVGATPRQQVLVTVFEGVIITVTATLLGLVMTAVGMVVFLVGLGAMGLEAAIVVPWGDFAAVTAVCIVVVIAATTLPTLPSLRRPAREVAAQLAAD